VSKAARKHVDAALAVARERWEREQPRYVDRSPFAIQNSRADYTSQFFNKPVAPDMSEPIRQMARDVTTLEENPIYQRQTKHNLAFDQMVGANQPGASVEELIRQQVEPQIGQGTLGPSANPNDYYRQNRETAIRLTQGMAGEGRRGSGSASANTLGLIGTAKGETVDLTEEQAGVLADQAFSSIKKKRPNATDSEIWYEVMMGKPRAPFDEQLKNEYAQADAAERAFKEQFGVWPNDHSVTPEQRLQAASIYEKETGYRPEYNAAELGRAHLADARNSQQFNLENFSRVYGEGIQEWANDNQLAAEARKELSKDGSLTQRMGHAWRFGMDNVMQLADKGLTANPGTNVWAPEGSFPRDVMLGILGIGYIPGDIHANAGDARAGYTLSPNYENIVDYANEARSGNANLFSRESQTAAQLGLEATATGLDIASMVPILGKPLKGAAVAGRAGLKQTARQAASNIAMHGGEAGAVNAAVESTNYGLRNEAQGGVFNKDEAVYAGLLGGVTGLAVAGGITGAGTVRANLKAGVDAPVKVDGDTKVDAYPLIDQMFEKGKDTTNDYKTRIRELLPRFKETIEADPAYTPKEAKELVAEVETTLVGSIDGWELGDQRAYFQEIQNYVDQTKSINIGDTAETAPQEHGRTVSDEEIRQIFEAEQARLENEASQQGAEPTELRHENKPAVDNPNTKGDAMGAKPDYISEASALIEPMAQALRADNTLTRGERMHQLSTFEADVAEIADMSPTRAKMLVEDAQSYVESMKTKDGTPSESVKESEPTPAQCESAPGSTPENKPGTKSSEEQGIKGEEQKERAKAEKENGEIVADPMGKTGKKKTSQSKKNTDGTVEYEAVENERQRKFAETWVEEHSLAELKDMIDAAVRGEPVEINNSQGFQRIIQMAEEGKLELDNKTYNKVLEADIRISSLGGQILQSAKVFTKNLKENISNGTATTGEVMSAMTRTVKGVNKSLQLSSEVLSDARAISDGYKPLLEERQRLWTEIEAEASIKSSKDLSGIRKRATEIEKSIRQQDAARHAWFAKVIDDSGMKKSEKKNALYDYIQQQGIYLHSWVDMSLLSSPAGRIFDQLNGWQVAFEENLPLTRAINLNFAKWIATKGGQLTIDVTNSKGDVIGTRKVQPAGHIGVPRGLEGAAAVRYGVQEAFAEGSRAMADRAALRTKGDSRKSKVKHNTAAGAVMREITTYVTQLGDMPIRGMSRSFAIAWYKDANMTIEQAYLKSLVDPDGIVPIFEEKMYFEQGLGTVNYSLSGIVRKGLNELLEKVPASGFAKENAVKTVERALFGYWNVQVRVGMRGLSRASLGIAKFGKAMLSTKEGSLERALEVRRAVVDCKSGLEVGALGFFAGIVGMVTGAMPDSDEEIALWEAEGRKPYSIKVGDTYLELARHLGGFATPFIVYSTLGDGVKRGHSPEKIIVDATIASIDSFGSFSGAENLLKATKDISHFLSNIEQGPPRGLQTFAAGMIKMQIPFGSFINQSTSLADPYQRYSNVPINNEVPWSKDNITSWLAGLAATSVKGVGGRFFMPIKQDSIGQELTNFDRFRMFTIASLNVNDDHPVLENARRLHSLNLPVMPSNRPIVANDADGNRINLDTKEQHAVYSAVGMNAMHRLDMLVRSDEWEEMTPEEQQKAWLKARDENKGAVVAETLQRLGVSNVEGISTTYDYSDSLSEEDLAVLRAYRLLDTDDQGKWLEDNTNNFTYLRATWNNKELLDQLTEADRNLQYTNSLAYQLAAAEVNLIYDIDPRLQELYRSINLTEWRELKDEDYELYERLLWYDTLRAGKGCSRKDSNHNKNKYYETKGSRDGSGVSGGGRRGSGGGGGSTRYHVPSLSDLKLEQFFPKGKGKQSFSETTSKKPNAPITLDYSKPTVSAGKGMKIEPMNFQNTASTVKYKKGETSQPVTDTNYMRLAKGGSAQSSFKTGYTAGGVRI